MNMPKRGFTLVELLVVIVVIGILAAIIIPSLVKGPRHAKLYACKKNLEEIHKGVMSYEASHQGAPPARGGKEASSWGVYLKDNDKGTDTLNNDLFFCQLMERMTEASSEEKREDDGDYMYNLSVNGMSALSSAVDEDTPLVADCVKDNKTSNHGKPADLGVNVILKNGSAITGRYEEDKENVFTEIMNANMVGGSNTENSNCPEPPSEEPEEAPDNSQQTGQTDSNKEG